MSHLEITLDNRLAELPKAHDWFEGIIARFGLSPKAAAELHVALEEHLTNIRTKPGDSVTSPFQKPALPHLEGARESFRSTPL